MKSKNHVFTRVALSSLLVSLIVFGSLLSLAQPALGANAVQGPDSQDGTVSIYRGVSTAVQFDISPPLRDIPPALIDPNQPFEDWDPPSGLAGPLGPQDVDPSVQTSVGGLDIPAPLISFDGFDNQLTYTPPDPVGDVGPNHYVAMSNVHFAVFDKAGNLLYGPVPNNTLWSGFGGDCESDNSGDPIVVYDQMADRWMLTQFTSSGPTYFNCVALSQTGDPTGAYYRYAFSTGSNFPDYPKYGVWPDAYYISTREFLGGQVGVGAYALERDEMLAGNPSPQVVSFLAPYNYNSGHGLLPSDLDGSTLPPAGSPNYFVGAMDNGGGLGAPQDALSLWEFHVDWATPGNSTFTLADTIPTDPFDSIFPCSPGSRDCIPQPGTSQKIDFLVRQRPLWRLAYRNMGTHEVLVTNQSVEAVTNMAGIRWYEVRDPGGSPYIYQQGTYAPGVTDGIHRWMGSIAMDRQGNMALGYSASNGTDTYPSVWYTGRLASDPLGEMSQGEGSFVDGSGSQLSTGSRWGDYTSMNIDPVDDCTFWYINEYYPATHSTEWYLRIGAFKFPSCGAEGADLSIVKTDTPDPVAPGGTFTYTLGIANNGPSAITSTTTVAANPATINIPSSGPATPYPSTMVVSGTTGTITKTTVTLHDINHTFPDDIDIILVGPGGESTYLMSDAGNGYDLVGITLTFDDDAAGPLPDSSEIVAGTYQPTNYGAGDAFPAPAPGGPYSAMLSIFDGTDPNGTWSLYVVDDVSSDSGNIASGWSLRLYTGDVVTVTDDLPAGVTVDGISAPGWTCGQAGLQITCTTRDLPVGPAPDIVITVTAPAATGYITNNVEIASTVTDTNPSNDSSYAVTLIDTAPLAIDDSYSTSEDITLTVVISGVLMNDTDPDGDPLTAALSTPPSNGSLVLNADGSFTYTPDLDFYGSDLFTYTLGDGYLTDTATVYLTVNPVNDAPVAEDDAYATPEDTPLVVAAPGVLDNDSDIDGDPLSATLDSGPSYGDLLFNTDGSFTYTPTQNWNGSDVFSYTVSDGALTDTAVVDLTVNPVNDAPVAADDAYTTTEDTALVIAAPGVLDNDSDIDGDPLSAVLDIPPANGTVVLNADGSFTYTPDLDYNGSDAFTYLASDGDLTAAATVTIGIDPVNDAPVAADDAYTTTEDTALVIAAPGVLDNDSDVEGDPLSASLDNGPSYGDLLFNADGSFTYTPTLNWNGSDVFTYTVSDGVLTDTAVVDLTVNPVNDAPVAADDVYTTTEDTALVIAAPGVLDNDSDIDGDVLSAVLDIPPANGTVVLNADGSFTYTPTLNWNGSDVFTYLASDGDLTAAATVTIGIDPLNDPPIVEAGENEQGDEGADLGFSGSYTDPELQTGEIHWDFGDGSTMTGTLTPTHAYADEGVYTVTLTVTDTQGAVGMDTLVVTVDNVAPDLAPLPDLGVDRDQAFTLTGTFTDPGWLDAHDLTIAWGDGVSETHNLAAGVLVFSTTYSYGAAGVYTATVTVDDQDGGQDSRSFTVTVAESQFYIYLPLSHK